MKSFCSFLMRDPEHWEDIAHLTTLPTLQTTKGVRNILLVFRWVACVECVCSLHVSVSVYMHCLLYPCDTVAHALWHWGPENTAGPGRLVCVCLCVCTALHTPPATLGPLSVQTCWGKVVAASLAPSLMVQHKAASHNKTCLTACDGCARRNPADAVAS